MFIEIANICGLCPLIILVRASGIALDLNISLLRMYAITLTIQVCFFVASFQLYTSTTRFHPYVHTSDFSHAKVHNSAKNY